MPRVFGFDIGTTSIGYAVTDYDPLRESGEILRLGVRIFPEARDPDGTPLNQTRRTKRLMRRQLRRRRERRRALNEALAEGGLLPAYGSAAWQAVMTMEPVELRSRGLSDRLEAHQLGRALYHLAKRRHFKGRDLSEADGEETAEEKESKQGADSTVKVLKESGHTLGQFLAAKEPHERRRGIHASRSVVADEFDRLWKAQSAFHPMLRDPALRSHVTDVIFAQRPVFWRKNTLGQCRFMPGEALCPKGSWLSQQRRMLEKLNNLALVGGNARPLDRDEHAAILEKLQVRPSMSWTSVRNALKPLFKARGEPGGENRLHFNLEDSESKLSGNAVEAKLAAIFDKKWAAHPFRQAIRDAVHQRLWEADYGQIGDQRVVILSEIQRKQRRAEAAQSFITDFGISADEAADLRELKLPTGWEPFSTAALQQFMPHLEAGVKFGALSNGPDWEDWRAQTFPDRDQPTGEVLDLLPSPAHKDEQRRIASLRNPTVVRTQNELRKVVNNLIDLYGKPDLIRVELAREVGKSKREREAMRDGLRKRERERRSAETDLRLKGIEQPKSADIEKWLLWKECGEFDPYSGRPISFDALFRAGDFDIEHIWPRWKSFDNSFANKTLCLRALNHRKANQTPFQAFGNDRDWANMKDRVWRLVKDGKMKPGKAKRFCREDDLPDDFASRQLNDTGFAARQAIAFLKRLWPDVGIATPVTVQAVTGRVTAQLRRVWGLNNILSDDGEKTRADHRHHAIDALVVACTHPGLTQKLSNYWQTKDDPSVQRPQLDLPWATIRADADRAIHAIVVSHRVRKKVSGPLHKETVYGDTTADIVRGKFTYRVFVMRKRLETLTKNELDSIRDDVVRAIVQRWITDHGGDPKRAFASYPRLGENGPEIRKVRLISKQQMELMARISTGYSDRGANHHVAVYRLPSGKIDFEVVSLFEASQRVAKRQPVVNHSRKDGEIFVMSLSAGDTVQFSKEIGQLPTLWRVQKIASKGQISLLDINDASPKEPSLFEPTVAGILSRNGIKVSVDPIGRIRPAHD